MKTSQASQRIKEILQETGKLHQELPQEQISLIAEAASAISQALAGGKKTLWFGNGGSATQSLHMAAEFVGRFQRERHPLPSLALTENVATLTAIGNDYSYEQIFARQLAGLAQPGDIAIGLSTSGNSANVIQALHQAKALKITTIGLTGGTGGQMKELCDICVCVSSKTTARIQEVHLTIGHILCELVEHELLSKSSV